jgi:HSP20 family protein
MRHGNLIDQIFGPPLFDDFAEVFGYGPTPVHEDKNNWVVYMDLPGVKKDDVKVSLDKDQIIIKAERKGKRPQKFEKVMCPGNTADLENVEATLVDGVLEVRIAKQKVDSPRMIEIK